MHHARKFYKTAAKKQLRQIMCPTIPSVGAKRLRNKKSYDAGHPRQAPDLHHEHKEETLGGPVDTGDQGFRQALRVAKEIHYRPARPHGSTRN